MAPAVLAEVFDGSVAQASRHSGAVREALSRRTLRLNEASAFVRSRSSPCAVVPGTRETRRRATRLTPRARHAATRCSRHGRAMASRPAGPLRRADIRETPSSILRAEAMSAATPPGSCPRAASRALPTHRTTPRTSMDRARRARRRRASRHWPTHRRARVSLREACGDRGGDSAHTRAARADEGSYSSASRRTVKPRIPFTRPPSFASMIEWI